jgi:hypothetical protein
MPVEPLFGESRMRILPLLREQQGVRGSFLAVSIGSDACACLMGAWRIRGELRIEGGG